MFGCVSVYQLHRVLYGNNTGTSRAIDSPLLIITANWQRKMRDDFTSWQSGQFGINLEHETMCLL